MTITAAASNSRKHLAISVTLTAWFLVILGLSLNEFFIPQRGETPLNLLISGGASFGLFFILYQSVPRFRDYVLNMDMRFLIMLHSWRMLGIGFVMLYLFDALPPLFAFLAGFGDAAAALVAVFLAYALFTREQGVSKKWILRWNSFGLLDFIIAVSIGVLTQTDGVLFAANGIDSDLMTVYPFVLIPGFLVQLFAITHIIIFLQLKNNFADKALVRL